MQLLFLLEQVVNGLVLGGYYLLIALGLSLIFSVGGIVNLAHGAFYALGAYGAVEIARHLGFGPAVVLSPIAAALLGVLFERFLLRRFYTADPILSLLVTFGLALVAEQAIRMIWGAALLPFSMPQAFADFGGLITSSGWFAAGTAAPNARKSHLSFAWPLGLTVNGKASWISWWSQERK